MHLRETTVDSRNINSLGFSLSGRGQPTATQYDRLLGDLSCLRQVGLGGQILSVWLAQICGESERKFPCIAPSCSPGSCLDPFDGNYARFKEHHAIITISGSIFSQGVGGPMPRNIIQCWDICHVCGYGAWAGGCYPAQYWTFYKGNVLFLQRAVLVGWAVCLIAMASSIVDARCKWFLLFSS